MLRMFGDKNEHDNNSDYDNVGNFERDSDNENFGNEIIMILMMLIATMVSDDEEDHDLQ